MHPLIDEREIARIKDASLGVVAEAVVLAMENRVDSRKRDILVATTITTNEVLAEKFVIVSSDAVDRHARGPDAARLLTRQHIGTRIDSVVTIGPKFGGDTNAHELTGIRGVRDIDEDAVVDAERLSGINRIRQVTFD